MINQILTYIGLFIDIFYFIKDIYDKHCADNSRHNYCSA